MWEVLNHLPSNLAGQVNMFLLEGDRIPLAETHDDLREGGCYSTVVRNKAWWSTTQEVVLLLCGESLFDEEVVKGLTVVPAGERHTLIKLWCTRQCPTTSKHLSTLCPIEPRFKPFASS